MPMKYTAPPEPSEAEKAEAFEWLRRMTEFKDIGERGQFLAYVALREWGELKRLSEADQRDAARYRWLRECDLVSLERPGLLLSGVSNLDAAVDAAMASSIDIDQSR